MRSLRRLAVVVAAIVSAGAAARQIAPAAPDSRPGTRRVTYTEALPVLERLAPDLAAAIARRPPSEHAAAWREWLSRRDAAVVARLARGDEDTVVNLLRFGTSFTRQPRLSAERGAPPSGDVLRARIGDLIAGLAAPGSNERLQYALDVVRRRGLDPSSTAGRDDVRAYLEDLTTRTAGEVDSYARTLAEGRAQGRGELAVRSTLYRQRGLSSDTSIRPDFAIDQALAALRSRGLLAPRSVQRVAVVGPGLDFTDKAEGYDFYPQQTTQPFSVIDSLRRGGLADGDRLALTTIDLSARVNAHLRAAQQRAAAGAGYLLTLPRERRGGWTAALAGFWRTAGGSIGAPAAPPSTLPDVDVRAIRVRPEIVQSIAVRDLDVVTERLDPLPDDERFDLVIATNVLVYYDVFEQSLALATIAAMLRPGGFLLSNNVLVELPATPMRSIGHSDAIYSDRPDDRDQIVWYRRN